MKVLTLALAPTLLGLTNALANIEPTRRGCQVTESGLEDSAVFPRKPSRRQQNNTIPTAMTVDVNFHIASTKADETLITDDIVNAQFEVLRKNYAVHNINLVLNSTERVVDDLTGSAFLINDGTGWKYHEEEYNAYLKATRRGGYDALNLYFFSSYSPGATGYCQFPTVTTVGSDAFYKDSCQISAETMPGMPANRSFADWNQGHIAVHEAGHWFGLNHTFVGGCSTTSKGDFVSDTPAQRSEVYGCPVGQDSCPDLPGVDPIHNFMGYTSDECTNEFTPGQKARMFETFFTFRRPT